MKQNDSVHQLANGLNANLCHYNLCSGRRTCFFLWPCQPHSICQRSKRLERGSSTAYRVNKVQMSLLWTFAHWLLAVTGTSRHSKPRIGKSWTSSLSWTSSCWDNQGSLEAFIDHDSLNDLMQRNRGEVKVRVVWWAITVSVPSTKSKSLPSLLSMF